MTDNTPCTSRVLRRSSGKRQTGVSSRIAILAIIFATLAATAGAQQSPYAPVKPLPLGDTLLSLPTSHMPDARTWEIRFSHRFNQSADQGNLSDRLHSLFGLDGSADVGFGVSYVARRDLQFSLFRSNVMDDYEIAAKYIVVQQAAAIPFDLALRGGADVRTEKNLEDRTSFFAQAIVAHQFGQRAEIFAMPTYVTNAGRVVNGNTSSALFRHAFNVPVGISLMIRPAFSLVAELVPVNRDLPDGTNADAGWAVGFKKAMGGHMFELMLTNNSATHADQYVTSTYQGTPLNRGDLHIGFNIERRFGGH